MGTRSATSWLILRLAGTISNVLDTGQTASIGAVDLKIRDAIANGVEATNASRALVALDQEITAGNTEDVNLYDFSDYNVGCGLGNDTLGQSLLLEEIVGLIVWNSGTQGQLEILGSVPPNVISWGPILTVANGGALYGGGILAMYQPAENAFDVTSGSSHRFRLGAVGATVTYSICVLGRHEDDGSSSSST
jgi:hypothetical protein